MRKAFILALCGGLTAAARADIQPEPQQLVFVQNAGPWVGGDLYVDTDGPVMNMPVQLRGRGLSDAQMQSQIRTALQQPRTGMDTWAWRDAVEERLLALGRPAVSPMRAELETRDGYEADALAGAIFRMENTPLNPNEMLKQWGAKRFAGPDPDTLKFSRVLDIRDTVGLGDLFPHHLFYVVEDPKDQARAVVALAADGKVQPLEDDAALTKFMCAEGEAQSTPDGRKRVAGAAAVLAISRTMALYKPDLMTAAAAGPTAQVAITAGGVNEVANVTFDAKGALQTLTTTQRQVEVKPTTPVRIPASAPAPPAMPE